MKTLKRTNLSIKQIAYLIKKNPNLVQKLERKERNLSDLLHEIKGIISTEIGVKLPYLSFDQFNKIMDEVILKSWKD